MALTAEEKLEIGKKIIKGIFMERRIPIQNFQRELGNEAKKLDVPKEKLMEFLRPIFYEMIEETFGKR